MVKNCPTCGYQNRESNVNCAVCNTPLERPEDAGRGGLPGQKNVGPEAIRGLIKIRIAAILAIVSFAVGVAMDVILISVLNNSFFFSGLSTGGTSPSSAEIQALTALMNYIIILALVTTAITLASVYFLFSGFGPLRDLNSRLGAGRTGSLLYAVGIILLIPTLLYFLYLFTTLVPGNPGGTVSTANLGSVSALIGIIFLLLAGAIIVLIGVIFLAIGLYRIGDIFGDTATRVGGILYVLLNIVGAILLVIGLSSIINRIRSNPPQETGTL